MAADPQAATNTAIARRFFTAWIGGDPAAFDEVLAPDYVFHDPADRETPPGPDGAKAIAAGFRAAFADMRPVEEDYVAGGDKVVYRWRVRATHRGAFAGVPPTGRPSSPATATRSSASPTGASSSTGTRSTPSASCASSAPAPRRARRRQRARSDFSPEPPPAR